MKDNLTQEITLTLCSRFNLSSQDISSEQNLFTTVLDSLLFLEYAKAIEQLCQKYGLTFSISDFLYDECLSIKSIVAHIEKNNPQIK